MAVVSGAFCQTLLNNLTAVANSPNWTTASSTGVWGGLSLVGSDDTVNYEATTGAAAQYGSSAGNGPGTEVATGHGYTQGGIQLAGPALTIVTGANTGLKWTCTAPVWTATDVTGITATYIFFYNNNATTKMMMFSLSLGGTLAATGNTATFTVTPAAGGFMTFKLK